ncbi:glutathione S-transferase [Hahella sp. CCB-MM4]|uniref:glutathione S-transferase family protein n=1 Tax=Hahella sp. (strain CCB-MM4) TaxID=1926491 RepID=UPI000B9B5E89|nr:glutathione S-transferase family protein [Hahella sp. CCB-MM4]OZG73542.1 glutathione S-transferase [Hahella sp. CCB-MM4]
MYTLYYLPNACSLATQIVLRELGQEMTLVNKNSSEDFSALNPVGMVPVLIDNDTTVREGAAVMLHILSKHQNSFLPTEHSARTKAIQDIMFANATMHPAYSRLFFIANNLADGDAKNQAFESAATAINKLWQVVDEQLSKQPFLGGSQFGVADIMLTVYSRWGEFFPVDIRFGENTERMLAAIQSLPSFQESIAAEQAQAA